MTNPPSDRPKPRPRQRASSPAAARRAPQAAKRAPQAVRTGQPPRGPVRNGRPGGQGGSSDGAKQKRARGGKRVLRIVAIVAAFLLVAAGVAAFIVYNDLVANLPDPTKPLRGTDLSTRILDRDGKPITTLFADQNRQYVELANIPQSLRNAVIATEDQRFYEHPGVDVMGIARALWVDMLSGKRAQGGSTITQQYAKQAFVGDESSLRRKLSEALLAYKIEEQYGKDKILEMYLNAIYFGHGSYGVQTAAQAYFGKAVKDLTVGESAVLAGVIKSPARYSPYLEPEAAVARRDTVLTQMRDQGYIDAAQYAAAVAEPITTSGLKQGSSVAPYFVEYLKQQLVEQYGEEAVYRGGLTVTTTLDLKMQTAAEKAVAKNLDRKSDPSAALVAVDPATGEIRAMVGGRDFSKQQYNVAVQGHRQSGSAFKPFVLVAALQDGISPEATFTAKSAKFDIPGGQVWSVAGESGYTGPTRVRVAMVHSLNPVFAQLVLKIGADRVVKTASEMGITTKITPVPAVALGGMAEGVTPLEMASAYGTLASGGTHAPPIGILKVTDKDGNVLFTADPKGKRVLDAAIAYLTTDILKGVITGGTGTAAGIGRPAAGKTGTTQDNADAWFVGYTPDLACAVWVGYADSKRPMSSVHGIRVTGGSFPARIWAAFMKAALKGTPANQFKKPSGLVSAKICLTTGQGATALCPKTGSGLFLTGGAPDPCTKHRTPVGLVVPQLVGLQKAEAFARLDAMSLRYTVTEKNVAGVAAGIVSAQTPTQGSKITSTTVVALTVSTGGEGAVPPPTAAFSWTPSAPKVGSAVKFDAGASTASGSIKKWLWEFGDKVTDSTSGKTANHTYTAAGTYDVVLWVTDDAGTTVSIKKQVTVK